RMFDLMGLAAVDPHADEAPAPMPEDGSRDRGYKILRDIDLHPGITTMSGHLPGNVACPWGIAGRRALPCGTTFAIDNKNEAHQQVPDMHSPRVSSCSLWGQSRAAWSPSAQWLP